MDMSLKNCWDCPIPLSAVAAQFSAVLLVALLGAALQRSRRAEVRQVGWAIVVLAFLFAAAVTRAVPRWGILRSESPLNVFSRQFAYAFLMALDTALLSIVLLVAKYSSRKRTALPNSA